MFSNLSISIPSYERHEAIERNILVNLDCFLNEKIKIYIFDDSSSDKLKRKVDELIKVYPYIEYIKNKKTLGHDKNFFQAIRTPKSEFIWVIGDSTIINPLRFKEILKVIQKNNPNLICLNKDSRIKNHESGLKKDPNFILENFGWHLTYTGATIYKKQCFDHSFFNEADLPRNFPQIYIIFNVISIYKDSGIYWLNNNCISAFRKSQSYWIKDSINVFIFDWKKAINKLPDTYSEECKHNTELSHSVKTNIFDFKMFIILRSYGSFNINIFKNSCDEILAHTNLNRVTLIVIALTPKHILFTLLKIWIILKKIISKVYQLRLSNLEQRIK
jgi:hypothetical protein